MEKNMKKKPNFLVFGIALGSGIGATLGVTFHNIALGGWHWG